MKYIERAARTAVVKGLRTMPAVFLHGPRQAGKSTLVSRISREDIHGDYVSLDDLSLLSLAKSNPGGFLEGFKKPLVIDEVQMAPELFPAIKKHIDEKRLSGANPNGQFLLTGSTGLNAIPSLSEFLVGRMLLVTLYPFSANETAGGRSNFIPILFGKDLSISQQEYTLADLPEMIGSASYPQLVTDPSLDADSWFESYIRTLVTRDVRNLAQIEKIHEIPALLKVLAGRAGGLINDADLARSVNLNHMTLRRYKSLLEQVFLIFTLPPWYGNIVKRLVKAPKVYFTDTLLLTYLTGYKAKALQQTNLPVWGTVLENFVATELIKQLSVDRSASLFYFRTTDHKEVDFIVEKRNGEMAGIEVKNSSTVKPDDFRGLHILKAAVKEKFRRGIVLYNGTRVLAFAEDMLAVPLSAMWA